MIQVAVFVFNFIQVNTYVLYSTTGDCLIIDPACYSQEEVLTLERFIEQHQLKPYAIVLTHPHIDHVVGVEVIKEKYSIPVMAHLKSPEILNQTELYAANFGFNNIRNFLPDKYLNDGDEIYFGKSSLQVLYTPGHAEGSICLYSKEEGLVFTGDVLFQQGIGRTDLPTGNYQTLIGSIKTKLMTLPDPTVVYPGHGDKTTIGEERRQNPFL
jgi:glyoxylase-like metal-dependent hydrolase (beta-lactamase superfamily II)